MGLLMFSARVHDLMKRKSNIEYRLMRITRQISDVQDYAIYVGNNTDGNFDIGDLLNMPGTMIRRTLGYTSNAYQQGMQNANAQSPELYNYWLGSNGMDTSPETQNAMYQTFLYKMYEVGVEKAAEKEKLNLKREEEKLKSEKEQLETLAKEVEQELQAARQARDAGIKEMAPKYVAGGQ